MIRNLDSYNSDVLHYWFIIIVYVPVVLFTCIYRLLHLKIKSWRPQLKRPVSFFLNRISNISFLLGKAPFPIYDICCRLAICEYNNTNGKANGSFPDYYFNPIVDRNCFRIYRFYVIIMLKLSAKTILPTCCSTKPPPALSSSEKATSG